MRRSLSRRQFLAGAAATTAAVAAGRADALGRRGAGGAALPNPRRSGLDHIVVVCMENRSFDHYLGWLPGADGRQAGLSYPDDRGVQHPTHHLTGWQGCGFNDPDHSYGGGRVQLDGGRCDGFRKSPNDDYALGYYTRADLPFYGPLTAVATTFDRYFCSILGPTYPNRFYTHAAATDRIDNVMRFSTLPTIWDSLARAGAPARYYFSDLPFLGLWGQKYLPIARRTETFYADALAGDLPAYSYVEPFLLGEDQGGSNDDHPHADIRRGQAFLSQVAAAVTNGPLWDRTALVVTYDEWGGFFDHVAPPRLPDSHDPGVGPDHSQAGFRVPCFVLSPFARRGYVGHHVYDHTSILKMVEWRWGLAPLTRRDAGARNLAETFTFSRPRTDVPHLPLVADPGPHVCGTPGVGMASDERFWEELRDAVLPLGWGSVG